MNNHLQRHIAVLALMVIAVSLFFPFVPVAHAEWTEKEEFLETYKTVGQLVTVLDKNNKPAATSR